jgi:hypothetical protein
MVVLHVQRDRAPAEELKRIALELLDDALRRLRSRSARSRARNVHETRKRLKELRAVVGLLEGGAHGRWIAKLFRAVGKELSASREADAMLEALDGLRLAAADSEQARECLRRTVAPIEYGVLRARLAAAREEIVRWPVDEQPLRRVDRRLRRTYRSARRRMERALVTTAPGDFHEWRKRAKEQWYQSLLLADVIPELEGRQGKLRDLSRALGDHHDLMLLRDALDKDAFAAVIEAIDRRAAVLERKAITLGAALFAEPPRLWMPASSRRGSGPSAILPV